MTTPMDTSDGALFAGRYRIIRRLGQGGMARVFLAQDESLHREVAIKVLSDRHSDDPHFIERFQREARAAARLNHPNIVQVYDQSQGGMSFIVQEYVEGETLKDLIRRESPLEPRRAITIALQILAALRVAHQQGVVHRDVKPQNILMQTDGKAKVADFGIASAGGDTEMTEAGSIVGTAQYLAPEQARGLSVGPPADLYAVGIVLYEMLSGRVPFEGDTAVNVAMRHVQEAPEPLTDRNPLVPVALEAVVMRALAKDPRQRYQSADEMGIELDRVRQGLPISDETAVIGAATLAMTQPLAPPPSETMVAPPLPPRDAAPARGGNPNRKRLWILLAVVGVVLLAIAVGAYAFTRGDSGGGGTSATTSTTSALVEIPDLVGQSQADATAALKAAGLAVLITKQASADVPADQVIAMRPNAGGKVPAGTTIELQVSSGPNVVTVPSVQGAAEGDATAQLQALGLVVTTVQDSSDSVAEGNVISQAPSSGVQVKPGSTVTLTISSGKKASTVPNVTKMDVTNAQNTLIAAGLVLGSQTQANDPAPVGQVISQDPAAGTSLPAGGAAHAAPVQGPRHRRRAECRQPVARQRRGDAHERGLLAEYGAAGDERSGAGRHRHLPGSGRQLAEAPGLDGDDRRRPVHGDDDLVGERLRVAVLGGGRSSEHDVSLRSAESVANGLDPARFDVVRITVGRDGVWTAEDGSIVSVTPGRGGPLGCDVVFPVLHGPYGEDGTVQGLLEMLDVAYVGSGVLGAALTMDKERCKAALRDAGIDVAREVLVGPDDERGAVRARIEDELGFPVFVKPARLGSSVGISRVNAAFDLDAALDLALAHDDKVIVEELLVGKEVECSVLGLPPDLTVSLVGEITFDAEWYDYEAKYAAGGSALVVPAGIPEETSERQRAIAARAFTVCDCHGMARVDFFLTDDGRLVLNEINAIPGFTATSYYARMFEATGIAYPDLLTRLVDLAVERHARNRGLLR